MTGTTRSSHGLDDRRKRLLYRCWHRGTREMDLILGRFADAHVGVLDDAGLDELERLIAASDPDLYAALTGGREPSPDFAGAMFERVKAFRISDWQA
jgi:antitoxin CptB